jgi:phenylalanyl-tRNA synthetase alpha chain
MTETADRIEQLRREAADAIAAAGSSAALEEVRIRFLGRKAELPNLLRSVAQLAPEQRAATGKAANQARKALEAALEAREGVLASAELHDRRSTARGRPAAPDDADAA